MSPTNEQIIAEAERRRDTDPWPRNKSRLVYVIEVMREGWTPPKPVDPDVLAYREWEARAGCSDKYRKEVLEGKWDHNVNARAYLAGARMAREQERDRARKLAEFVEDQSRRLDGVGARAYDILAEYLGEA